MTFRHMDVLDDPLLCCCSCLIFADDFNRTDSPYLGDDWVEAAGVWSIASNTLEEDGTADAKAICQVRTTTEEQSISVELANRQDEVAYGIIANYKDGTHYFHCEVEWDGLGFVEIRLYDVNTLLVDPPDVIDEAIAADGIQVCITEDSFTVTVGEATAYACISGLYEDGFYSGLYNGTAEQANFDNYYLENYEGSDANVPDYPSGYVCCIKQCRCYEDGDIFCIPRELVLTFIATAGCEDELNDVTVNLSYDIVEGCWKGASDDPSCMYGTGPPLYDSANIMWKLYCYGDPNGTETSAFWLTSDHDDGSTVEDDCMQFDYGELTYTCDPFSITFPTKVVPSHEPGFDPERCGCCDQTEGGTWIAVVTPAAA